MGIDERLLVDPADALQIADIERILGAAIARMLALELAMSLLLGLGVSYAQASLDLGVHQSQLRGWVKALAGDPQHAFPGQGQMKPEQLEIAQLKREVIRLKAERDILKKAAAYFAKEST
jgi:transposase